MPNIYYNKKIPADENTIALLHFDDPNNIAIDACGNTWSVTGSPTISSDNSKFGGKSLYLNGSSLIRTTNDYTLGDTDFTIDAWVNILQYCDRSDTGRAIFNFDSNKWHIAVFYGGQMSWQQNIGGAVIQTNAAVPKNEWHHIAVTHRKSANLTSLYLDGALQGTLNETITMLTGKLTVGLHAYQTRYFIGYIDEFRISNVARWTSDFTPPTSPYKLGEKIGTRSIELSEVN